MKKEPVVISEQMKFEMNLYEKLIAEKPDYADALSALADLYTKTGEIKKGLKLDLKLSKLRPQDEFVFYNLACSWCLTGQVKKAYEALKKSIQLGYDDLEHLEHDSDLDGLRKSKRYAPLLKDLVEALR